MTSTKIATATHRAYLEDTGDVSIYAADGAWCGDALWCATDLHLTRTTARLTPNEWAALEAAIALTLASVDAMEVRR